MCVERWLCDLGIDLFGYLCRVVVVMFGDGVYIRLETINRGVVLLEFFVAIGFWRRCGSGV